MSTISCFTEWDKLEAIIVGVPDYNCQPDHEPGVKAKIFSAASANDFPVGLRPPGAYVAAQRELDNLIRVLTFYGVKVEHPEVLDWNQGISTPWWTAPVMHGASCPRDIITVIGKDIIESGMSSRCRFFEYAAYRGLIGRCLELDPASRWTAAPKPVLWDKAYRSDYPWKEDSEKRSSMIERKEFVTTEEDVIFEAADIMKFGRDLFVRHGFTTNLKGIDWLRRHLSWPNADAGVDAPFRVHAIDFPNDLCPLHMDATFFPIKAPDNERKGVIYNSPARRLRESLKPIFRDSFDILDAPQAQWTDSPPRSMCSPWLSMNMLHIDPSTIIVESTEKNTIKHLESLGMKVVQCPFRSCYEMGGSFHCHTSDLHRQGMQVDYFKHLTTTQVTRESSA